ncbi:MAG TPA: LLM class flavin-dependent oxidoreductase [Thermomicrobiales bacterium]|nr:LLM class flavin-dependent oxidoreductase [Thermomicrobiales bacterium]
MHYGFIITAGDPRTAADLAHEAEAAGWDGVFTWDGIAIGDMPSYDPWVTMAAMAMRTERVRLGAILTPPSRRRPWKLARETMTLDHLSNGRLIVPVGLGALDDAGFGAVGETTDRATRAALLDESLDILEGLWSGQPFAYAGKHYAFPELTFLPPTVQQPRIPIWVTAAWPYPKSMARALRYDGILPNAAGPNGQMGEASVEQIGEIVAYVREHRPATTPFAIVAQGVTPAADPAAAAAQVQPWRDAGATWWIEADWTGDTSAAALRRRIAAGPPDGGGSG